MIGSRRFQRLNSTSVDDFLGFMIQELVCHGITTMLPKASLFTFRGKMLVMCCIEYRLIKVESSIIEMSGVIPVKANRGILASRAAQAMLLRR